MSTPPMKRVTALREVCAPQALPRHPRRRVLSRRPWPRAHAELFVHRRPCTCVACKKRAAKLAFHPCAHRLLENLSLILLFHVRDSIIIEHAWPAKPMKTPQN